VPSIERSVSGATRRPSRISAVRSALVVAALGLGPALPAAAQVAEVGLVVRQLRFTGNRAFGASVLAAALATTGSSWVARSHLVRWMGLGEKRFLNEREFRRDVPRLRLFYQIHGYLDVQVDTAVVRTDQDAYVTFVIREGAPVLVRTLEIKGLDSLSQPENLVVALPLRVGDPYDRTLLLATADTIGARLQDRGYPEARVFLERREVDRVAHTADISLVVEPGKPAVIGEIHIEGTRIIDSSFVRSLLATAPGRPFRARDLNQSQRNLYRSELFRYAAVNLDTAHYVPGSGTVPLTIQVAEGTLHRAQASVGYGTYDCFRSGVGWTARNALGHGQVFDVSAQVSKLGVGRPFAAGLENNWLCGPLADDSIGSSRANYNVTTSFRRPVFLSPSNSLTLALFAERRSEFSVWLREDVGGSVTLTRETPNRIPISLAYRLSYGRTEANAVSFCAFFNACTETDVRQLRQRRLIATVTAGVQRTRVNNSLDPSRGSALSLEGTHSSRFTGSSEFAQFTRVVGDAAWYHTIGDVVLSLHARGGMVFAPVIQLQGGAGNFVPPEQRFYAGGANDVRGYHRNELGPIVYVVQQSAIDTVNDVVPDDSVRIAATGGNSLAIANVEIRAPIGIFRDRLRGAIFVDGGTVWERGGGAGSGPAFRITPGAGLRFVTPLGPARIDVAYNGYNLPPGRLYAVQLDGDLTLFRDSYQRIRKSSFFQNLVFQFSVGQAF
jgi:outer membrane protein assembly complex protein YaeT